jgi:hypothetical protein
VVSPKDVSNALVVAAEAHRQALSVYAQMVADGEQEKQRLAEGLVKCEAAYAGLLTEREALKNRVDQLEVQLAGCGVAALDGSKKQEVTEGMYGWSPAYADVLKLRREVEDQCRLIVRYAELESDAKEILAGGADAATLAIQTRIQTTLDRLDEIRKPF